MTRVLRAERYLTPDNKEIGDFIVKELPYLDLDQTLAFYADVASKFDKKTTALLGCNDRFFLLTALLNRRDAVHPWLFDRCREVEKSPDGHIDLWARFHYKSTIITFAGSIQEILSDPEITIAIFSVVKPIAQEFLSQIKEELESNDLLKDIYADVLYQDPKKKDAADGRPHKWGVARGITVKRKSNPKEATIEAHGLLDGQPVGRHFKMHIYDDVVTQDYLAEDQIKKTTERWEMADNLGSHEGVRKWVAGTRYHFADTYSVILDRKSLVARVYPATDDGTEHGTPVFLPLKRWQDIKRDQRSTLPAQMLLNPIAGSEATFRSVWFRTYDIFPSLMTVYIMCDPSKGMGQRSDRTAIAVVGIDVAGNKYLLDGYRHRMKLSERYRLLQQLYNKWLQHPGVQLVQVGYERYGQLTDLEVIQEYQERERNFFEIKELNTPRQGKHSKDDRIERLEPDIRNGAFYLPATVWHPDYGGKHDNAALWKPWTDADDKAAKERAAATGGEPPPYSVGQIVYRPMIGPTRNQRMVESRFEMHRVVRPIRRRDEQNEVYDLTRCFIEEAMRHPYASHDDLIDAVSRIYDMDIQRPVRYDAASVESLETTLENAPTY